jgi:hypothetical protein
MGNLFVKERLVDLCIVAIDSTLFKAKGHLWHKSSMIEGVVPCSGIDTDDLKWGFSQPYQGLDFWLQTTFDIKYRFLKKCHQNPLSLQSTNANCKIKLSSYTFNSAYSKLAKESIETGLFAKQLRLNLGNNLLKSS